MPQNGLGKIPNSIAERVFLFCIHLIERTVDRHGQMLLLPELEYAFWDTTLPIGYTPQAVIELYQDHGTHEQYHRVPSRIDAAGATTNAPTTV